MEGQPAVKSFLNTTTGVAPTHREQVIAYMSDGGWHTCRALQGLTGLSRTETHSALQQEMKYHRVESEYQCAGGKMPGITQRYRLLSR